jgi:glycosyltransferase involved in cell wall biosynthesis
MADIFKDEALLVTPEDTAALAEMITRAWKDDELRRRTAEAGLRYARSLGGEPDLYQRILCKTLRWYRLSRGSYAVPAQKPPGLP